MSGVVAADAAAGVSEAPQQQQQQQQQQEEDSPEVEEAEQRGGGQGSLEIVEGQPIELDSDASEPDKDSDPEKERQRLEPQDDGRYYDDPLWYGKTLDEIRCATAGAKAEGNSASREGDWKLANRYWKDALKGAQKLKDAALELTLRLNLALGYTKREKPAKALEQCDAIFAADVVTAASPEQRAKAHYRRAEAYTLSGDIAKAIASFRASLEIDPGNAEVRRKLSVLRQAEAERRRRERDFFGGPCNAMSQTSDNSAAAASAAGAASEEQDEAERAEAQARSEGLTDKARSARLSRFLAAASSSDGAGLNVECGQPVTWMGPLSVPAKPAPAKPAAAEAAKAGGEEPSA